VAATTPAGTLVARFDPNGPFVGSGRLLFDARFELQGIAVKR
jgi:hypothetical protein